MANFNEKVSELEGQEVLLKDVNNSAYTGVLKEVGEDYLILAIARRVILYNFAHVVSVEPRTQAFSESRR